jgi:hypothetical protein
VGIGGALALSAGPQATSKAQTVITEKMVLFCSNLDIVESTYAGKRCARVNDHSLFVNAESPASGIMPEASWIDVPKGYAQADLYNRLHACAGMTAS